MGRLRPRERHRPSQSPRELTSPDSSPGCFLQHPQVGCTEQWTGQMIKSPGRQLENRAHRLVWESDKHMKNDQEKKPRHFTRKTALPHSLKIFPIRYPGKISLRICDMLGFHHRLQLSVFTWGRVLFFYLKNKKDQLNGSKEMPP